MRTHKRGMSAKRASVAVYGKRSVTGPSGVSGNRYSCGNRACGIVQEVQESFLINARPMNPFQATFTVEHEAALEPGRARGVTKKAAILVDIEHDVLRKDSEQRYRRLILPNTQQANVGLVGTVHFHGIISDTAAELARQLLDPAVDEGNIGPPDKRIAIGRGARRLGLWKIRVVLGAGSVAWRRDGIAW